MNIHKIFLSLSLLIVPAFIHADATLNKQLYQACQKGDVATAASLIAEGADVNSWVIEKQPSLTFDAMFMQDEYESTDDPQETLAKSPLHAAIDAQSKETLILLLENGADINIFSDADILLQMTQSKNLALTYEEYTEYIFWNFFYDCDYDNSNQIMSFQNEYKKFYLEKLVNYSFPENIRLLTPLAYLHSFTLESRVFEEMMNGDIFGNPKPNKKFEDDIEDIISLAKILLARGSYTNPSIGQSEYLNLLMLIDTCIDLGGCYVDPNSFMKNSHFLEALKPYTSEKQQKLIDKRLKYLSKGYKNFLGNTF